MRHLGANQNKENPRSPPNSGEAASRILVSYKGKVLDLTGFANKHPGGSKVIRKYQGCEVDEVVFNSAFHKHNQSIHAKLLSYEVRNLELSQTFAKPSKME